MQWQVRQMQTEIFRRIHHVLLGRQRQTFKVGQRLDGRDVNASLAPDAPVVRVAASAQRQHVTHLLRLQRFDVCIRIAQDGIHGVGCSTSPVLAGRQLMRAILSFWNTSSPFWL